MKPLPSLYLITDRTLTTSDDEFFAKIEELLKAGVRLIQLREKDLPAAKVYRYAMELRELTHRYESLLLINDRIDIVQAVNADGVHLGGHSVSVNVARQILGSDRLIGVSTHNQAEVSTAQNNGADFVTFGPVFDTPSKASFGPPVGVDTLKRVCRSTILPVYALGGIKEETQDQLKGTGIYGIAGISSFINSASPAKTCQTYQKTLTFKHH